MREITIDGLMMCRIQGRIFEMSLDYLKCSSPLFVKKYMFSKTARSMDKEIFLNTTKSDIQALEELDNGNEFGQIQYGSETLYWMGYLYRYFSFTYEIDSKKLYKLIPASKLEKLYYVYHTFDCAKAIEKIIENNHLQINTDLNLQAQELIEKRLGLL